MSENACHYHGYLWAELSILPKDPVTAFYGYDNIIVYLLWPILDSSIQALNHRWYNFHLHNIIVHVY